MKTLYICLLVCFLFTGPAFSQTRVNEAGFQTENDSYLAQGSDRYYTNGIFVYYRHALKLSDGSKLKNKVLGFEAGQKMFNPQSASIPDMKYVDRPFAGYLYVGANLNLLYQNESNLKLSAQLGVVGSGSGAYEIQKDIHKWFGFYPPEGWDYQVHDGAEINLSAEYNRLLTRGKGVDLTLNSYANLGTGFDGLGVGPLLRLGDFNQLYSSVSTQSTASRLNKSSLLHPNELFFYYKPMLNYVAYDATVQGSLFGDHTQYPNEILLTPNRLVFSNQLGVSYAPSRWVIDASVIFHTKDVKQMVKAHQWGSVTLLYRW